MALRVAIPLALLLASTSGQAVERLSGDQIRRSFEGNTVAGRYSGSNLPFSEYHHPDGRVSGHNRGVPNTDACWITTADAVCYYYGQQEKRRTYCFTVDLSGRLNVLRTKGSGRINGMAVVEPGDPNNFAKSAAAWTCDGLISQVPGGRLYARR